MITAALMGVVIGAPAIGALIGTALTLGLGVGFIGLGAFMLRDNKQIEAGFEKLGKKAKGVFERAAGPLKGPFLDAMRFIGDTLKDLEPSLKGMFAAVGPMIMPLVVGLMGLLENAMPGITDALINAQPLFTQLAVDLPVLGLSIGEFFKTISENGPELMLFLSDLIFLVSGAILVFGDFIAWLTTTYAEIRNFFTGIPDMLGTAVLAVVLFFDDVRRWLFGAGQGLMMGFTDGIKDKIGSVISTVTGAMATAIRAAKMALQSNSPSKVFMTLGQDTVAGYTMGVDQGRNQVRSSWSGLLAMPGSTGHRFTPNMAMPGRASSTAGGGPMMLEATINIDGRAVVTAITPAASSARPGPARQGWADEQPA